MFLFIASPLRPTARLTVLLATATILFSQVGTAAEHWSLQPIKRVQIPKLDDPWIATPVDAFISLAELAKNLKMYGPGFDFFNQKGGLSDYKPVETFAQEGWRRMIYATKIRMQPVDIFGSFDCPDAGQMTPKRPRSITPIQALSMMNSAFINDQAAFFSERVRREVGDDTRAQVCCAVMFAFSRAPRPEELERLEALAMTHGLEQICRALFNANEFVYIP